MNEDQAPATSIDVPRWYPAAVPALLAALAFVVVLARLTA